LILRIIIKIDATRCQILRLKCTKSFSVGTPPHTPLGELTALPRPHSMIKCDLLLREGEGYGKGEGREKQGRGGKERGEGTGREGTPNIYPLHF